MENRWRGPTFAGQTSNSVSVKVVLVPVSEKWPGETTSALAAADERINRAQLSDTQLRTLE